MPYTFHEFPVLEELQLEHVESNVYIAKKFSCSIRWQIQLRIALIARKGSIFCGYLLIFFSSSVGARYARTRAIMFLVAAILLTIISIIINVRLNVYLFLYIQCMVVAGP